MEAKSYTDLMQMARQRHAAISTELKALEAAFPDIGLPLDQPKKQRTYSRTRERRAQQSLAMKAAWARRKAAKPNGSDSDATPTAVSDAADVTTQETT